MEDIIKNEIVYAIKDVIEDVNVNEDEIGDKMEDNSQEYCKEYYSGFNDTNETNETGEINKMDETNETDEINEMNECLKVTHYYEEYPTHCQANCCGNCNGEISKREFICRYRPTPNNEYGGNFPKTISFCDFHYYCIMTKNDGISPTPYYEYDLGDAIYELITEYCKLTNLYTFWYCEYHDNGFLIKDNDTSKVPEWFKMCNDSINCDQIWWCNKGVIDYDGKHVIELKNNPIANDRNYYNRVGGDFKFKFYSSQIFEKQYNENTNKYESKEFEIVEISPLNAWFFPWTFYSKNN